MKLNSCILLFLLFCGTALIDMKHTFFYPYRKGHYGRLIGRKILYDFCPQLPGEQALKIHIFKPLEQLKQEA